MEFTPPKVELHPDLLDVLKTRGLKIAHLNISSLPKKIDELRLFLRRCRDIGILPLNETWLNDQLPSDEVAIPSFNLFRRDHSSSRNGTWWRCNLYIRQNTGCAKMRFRRYGTGESLAGVIVSKVKKNSGFWEPVIARRMTLSFWKSLNWVWKGYRERIKKRS